MGIRFYCPNGHKLNVKAFLAGKRGICPDCDAKFLVPMESGGTVAAIDDAVPTIMPLEEDLELDLEPASPVGLTTELWHVRTSSGEQKGPATMSLVKTRIADGTIGRDTWVWKTGWLDWQRASDVFPELGAVLEAVPIVRPKSFVEESVSIKTEPKLPNDPQVTSMYRRRQRQKKDQIKTLTLFLGGMIILLLIVMLVVLLR